MLTTRHRQARTEGRDESVTRSKICSSQNRQDTNVSHPAHTTQHSLREHEQSGTFQNCPPLTEAQSCRSLNATQPSGSHDKCHKLTPVNLTSLATHQNNASCASHTSVLCSPPQSCSEFHQPPTTTYDGISFDKTADFHSHSLAKRSNKAAAILPPVNCYLEKVTRRGVHMRGLLDPTNHKLATLWHCGTSNKGVPLTWRPY